MRRPQNLCNQGNLEWIMNNLMEEEPEDWELDCWIPKLSRQVGKDSRSYYYYKGKSYLMYRATWEMWYDKDFPKAKVARHMCGDARCVNPLHIEPGTPKENEEDKKRSSTKATELKTCPSGLSPRDRVDWWLTHQTEKEGDCLNFLGSIGSDGYGMRNVNGRKKMVHRFILSVFEGLDYYDSSWVARHTCHNRSCINPRHLMPGSRRDNAYDSRGFSKASKLTEEDVNKIILAYKSIKTWPRGRKTEFKLEQAERYSVSPDTIGNIVFRRLRWKDLLHKHKLL